MALRMHHLILQGIHSGVDTDWSLNGGFQVPLPTRKNMLALPESLEIATGASTKAQGLEVEGSGP